MFPQYIMLIYSESLTLGKVSDLTDLIAVASKDNEKKNMRLRSTYIASDCVLS